MWILLLRDMAAGTPEAGGIPTHVDPGAACPPEGHGLSILLREPPFPRTGTPLACDMWFIGDRDRPWGPHARISPTTLINAGRRASDLMG